MEGQPAAQQQRTEASSSLDDFLRALPDEILTVVGSHMHHSDLLAGRLVCKRWRELLRPCPIHLHILPYYLAQPAGAPQPGAQQGGSAGGRALRPRRAAHITPTPAEKRQPPPCLQAPEDMVLLPGVFPGTHKVTARMLSRHHGGQGEGVTAQPQRVTSFFNALCEVLVARGILSKRPPPLSYYLQQQSREPQPQQQQDGSTATATTVTTVDVATGSVPAAGVGMTASHGHGADARGREGLQLLLTMDLDVPRSRYKAELAKVQQLVQTTIGSIARLGPGLTSLRILWYMARLAHMCDLPACFASLTSLKRLELSMTPGEVLLSLTSLTSLTALRIASVGEELHMQDLGVPRTWMKWWHWVLGWRAKAVCMHTEIQALSSLTSLSELYLDGWVCEASLLNVLMELTGLKALNLGEDLQGAAQKLPWDVLTRLTAVTLPISLTATPPGHELAVTDGTLSLGSETAGGRSRHIPQLQLPRLIQLVGPAPMARLHGQLPPSQQSQPAGMNAAATVAAGNVQPVSPQSGAARRRNLTPSIITPQLKALVVDITSFPTYAGVNGDLDVGLLPHLTRLDARVAIAAQDDLGILQPVMRSLSQGDFPALKEFYLQLTRPNVSPAAALAEPKVATALTQAAAAGCLDKLEAISFTRQWDGLVPEGWDYTTKGALAYNMPAGYTNKLNTSGILPMQHLRFVSSLPALTTLHLHTDRIRLCVLPTSLTCLTLEGLVHIDPSRQGDMAPGSQCPKLKQLCVMLAKHPRTHARQPSLSTAGGPTSGGIPVTEATMADVVAGSSPQHTAAASGSQAPTIGTAAPGSQASQPQPDSQAEPLSGTSTMAASGAMSGGVAGMKMERGQYCVLHSMLPVLSQTLTHLSFSATPSPTTTRLDQIVPADYGVPLVLQYLPNLVVLELYVMAKHQWLIDCRQLVGLSGLSQLRKLSFENPMTGATRLVCLTALSILTQITKLTTGKLDDEAYPGHVMLAGLPPVSRRRGLLWLSGLVAGRFGTLPTAPLQAAGSRSATPGAMDMDEEEAVQAETAPSESESEEGPGALLGSDEEVHSEDLLFDSEAGEELSSDELVFEPDEE